MKNQIYCACCGSRDVIGELCFDCGSDERLVADDRLPSNEDIAIHYGQIWDNVKHMTGFVEDLRNRYIKENL